MIYFLELFSMGVFAITGVIAARDKGMDIFSVIILSVITATGGGTIRDMLLGHYPMFWVQDIWFLWVPALVSMVAFFVIKNIRGRYQLLLYLDALGVALFSIMAVEKTLAMGMPASIAVVMGLITAIFGGILRDILTGAPSLLLSRELYATPVLVAICLFILIPQYFGESTLLAPFCVMVCFVFRACAIYFTLQYPRWLCV